MESTVKTRLMATAIALTAGTFLVAAHAQPGGGGPGAQTPGGAQQPAQEPKAGQQPKAGPQPKTADPKAQNGAPPKASAQPKDGGAPPKTTAQPKDDGASPKTAQPKDKAAPRADDKSAPKTGAKTGAQKSDQKVNITSKQRTEIRQTIIKSGNAPRVTNVNFNISVGTVVPSSVRFVALPPRVVEIYPEWRGYRYFIVGERIIIVEPDSPRIVFIIAA
jgi:Protein of unknown function (DUF1236)